jgi:hypothetical protein
LVVLSKSRPSASPIPQTHRSNSGDTQSSAASAGVVSAGASLHPVAHGEFQATPKFEQGPSIEASLEVAPRDVVGKNFGRFHVLGIHLTLGGVRIFSAVDTVLGRKVALRILWRRRQPKVRVATATVEPQQQKLREVLALAKVVHPNLSTVFDAGTFGDLIYWSMELLTGQGLSVVARSRRMTGPMLLSMLAPLAEALVALHQVQYFFGVISPEHIRIDTQGKACLWTLGPDATRERESRRSIVGERSENDRFLLDALAPELRAGGESNSCTDVYAFCALLAKALFGEVPVHRIDEFGELVLDIPRRCRGQFVPKLLIGLLRRGLAYHARDRIEDAAALVRQLSLIHWRSRRENLLHGSLGILPVAAAFAFGLSLWPDREINRCQGEESNGLEEVLERSEDALADAGVSNRRGRAREVHKVFSSLKTRAREISQLRANGCQLEDGQDRSFKFDLQHLCLRTRENEIRAILNRIAGAEPWTAQDLLTQMNSFPTVSSCAFEDRTRREERELSPEQMAQSKAIEDEEHAILASVTLPPRDKNRRLKALRKRALSSNLGAMLRAIDSEILASASFAGDFALVREIGRASSLLGIAQSDEIRVYQALLRLAYAEGYRQQDLAVMNDYANRARAQLRRIDAPDWIESDLKRIEAIYLWSTKGAAAALPLFADLYQSARTSSFMSAQEKMLSLINYGVALYGANRFDESISVHFQAWELAQSAYGEFHEANAETMSSLLELVIDLGYPPSILAAMRDSVAKFARECEARFGECTKEHPGMLIAYLTYLRATGDLLRHRDLAQRLFRYADRASHVTKNNLSFYFEYGAMVANFPTQADARGFLTSIDANAETLGARGLHRLRGAAIDAIAIIQGCRGFSDAERREVLARWNFKSIVRGADVEQAVTHRERAEMLLLAGKPDQAQAEAQQAVDFVRANDLWGVGSAFQIRRTDARVRLARGDAGGAYQVLHQLLAWTEKNFGEDSPGVLVLHGELSVAASLAGQPALARQHADALARVDLTSEFSPMSSVCDQKVTMVETPPIVPIVDFELAN